MVDVEASGDVLDELILRLQELERRRNESLREIYSLIRRREDIGSLLELTADEDGGLQDFLGRFDLEKNPETGSILNLNEGDTIALEPPFSEEDIAPPDEEQDIQEAKEAIPLTPTPVSPTPESLEPNVSSPSPGTPMDQEEDDDTAQAHKATPDVVLASPPPPSKTYSPAREEPSHSPPGSPSDGKSSLEPEAPPAEEAEAEEDTLAAAGAPPDVPEIAETENDAKDSPADVPMAEILKTPPPTPPPAFSVTIDSSVVSSQLSLPPQDQALSTVAEPSPEPNPATLVSDAHSENQPQYAFKSNVDEIQSDRAATPAQPQSFLFDRGYPMPPLSLHPRELLRQGKPQKQRKRDKEKGEKSSDKGDLRKDEWTPWGMVRWAATLKANPLWKRVRQAGKTLSTHDWEVAITELRWLRAWERVDRLRDSRESAVMFFRQPSKQRKMAVAVKTHWDHLLDEMKWMRIDYREERKWKHAIACQLAHEAMEWHTYANLQARVENGLCIPCKPPSETVSTKPEASIEAVDSARDEQYGDQPMDTQSSASPDIDPHTQEPLASMDIDAPEVVLEKEPKPEEVDDNQALRDLQNTLSATRDEENDQKSASGLLSAGGRGDSTPSPDKISKVGNPFSALRDVLVNLPPEMVCLSFDDLPLENIDASAQATSEDAQCKINLVSIFAELQVMRTFHLPDPSSSTSLGNNNDSKKKSSGKSDRDDPSKRWDETNYTKLTPLGRFTNIKPTLLTTLRPAKKFKDGKWEAPDDVILWSDFEGSKAQDATSVCSLFEGKPNIPSILTQPMVQGKEGKDRDRKKVPEVVWSPREDTLLKNLVDLYGSNWSLVGDAFNTCRHSIAIDKRTPLECAERYQTRWLPNISQAPTVVEEPPTPSSSTGMVTRGVKRPVSALVGNSSNGSAPENRKRRRHTMMFDAIRKVQKKKREAAQKANAPKKTSSNVHDTHEEYTKYKRLTPSELARIKAEKDAAVLDDLNKRRQIAMQQHVQAQRAVMHPAQQVPPGPNMGRVMPGGPVAQIRTGAQNQVAISQQQQQQRLPIPSSVALAGRYAQAQLMQTSGQQQAQAQAHAQAQRLLAAQQHAAMTGGAGSPVMNGTRLSPHMSPGFANRTTPASPGPHNSPPRNGLPGNTAASPNGNGGGMSIPPAGSGTGAPSVPTNLAFYASLTPEQLNQMMSNMPVQEVRRLAEALSMQHRTNLHQHQTQPQPQQLHVQHQQQQQQQTPTQQHVGLPVNNHAPS